MVPGIFGISLMVTSETRHCAPSMAAPSAVIRSTTSVGGSPGGMSAACGGDGACATASVTTVNERMPKRPAGAKLRRKFLRMANAPCRFFRARHRRATGKARQAAPDASAHQACASAQWYFRATHRPRSPQLRDPDHDLSKMLVGAHDRERLDEVVKRVGLVDRQ